MTINSLRFNTGGSNDYVEIAGGSTLTIATGGILATNNIGNHEVGFQTKGGTGNGSLTSGSADLVINNYQINNDLTVQVPITGAIGLTISQTSSSTTYLSSAASSFSGKPNRKWRYRHGQHELEREQFCVWRAAALPVASRSTTAAPCRSLRPTHWPTAPRRRP